MDPNNILSDLTKLLGYDPTREGPDADAMKAALKERAEKRAERLKAKGQEMLDEFEKLMIEAKKEDQAYEKKKKERNKKIGKAWNRIQALMNGRTPPTEEEEKAAEQATEKKEEEASKDA